MSNMSKEKSESIDRLLLILIITIKLFYSNGHVSFKKKEITRNDIDIYRYTEVVVSIYIDIYRDFLNNLKTNNFFYLTLFLSIITENYKKSTNKNILKY